MVQPINTKSSSEQIASCIPLGARLISSKPDEPFESRASGAAPGSEAPLFDDSDAKYLEAREQMIEIGIKMSISAAKALYEIHIYKEGLLWKREHPTFEAYCSGRWGYGKSHAYRLLNVGGFIHQAANSTDKIPLPISEGQARPLLQLPPERRLECWKGITSEHDPANLTSKIVTDEVGSFAAGQCIEIGRRPQQPEPSQRAAKILMQLRKTTSSLDRSEDIGKLIDKINNLLEH